MQGKGRAARAESAVVADLARCGLTTMEFSGIPECELRAWVEASCREQGVPVAIGDPATVAVVAALLARAVGQAPGDAAKLRERDAEHRPAA